MTQWRIQSFEDLLDWTRESSLRFRYSLEGQASTSCDQRPLCMCSGGVVRITSSPLVVLHPQDGQYPASCVSYTTAKSFIHRYMTASKRTAVHLEIDWVCPFGYGKWSFLKLYHQTLESLPAVLSHWQCFSPFQRAKCVRKMCSVSRFLGQILDASRHYTRPPEIRHKSGGLQKSWPMNWTLSPISVLVTWAANIPLQSRKTEAFVGPWIFWSVAPLLTIAFAADWCSSKPRRPLDPWKKLWKLGPDAQFECFCCFC